MSASGQAEQSFALDSSSVLSVDPVLRRLQAFGDHSEVSTMVLSETRAMAARPNACAGHPKGPVVRRVPWRDCKPGERIS